MAVLAMDGFDYYTAVADFVSSSFTAGRWTSTATGAVTFPTGRNGGKCMAIGNAGTQCWMARRFDASGEFVVGFAFKTSSFSNGDKSMLYILGPLHDSFNFSLDYDGTGHVEVRRGTNEGTVLGTSSAAMTIDQWSYIEVRVKLHATAGTVKLWIDGDLELDLSGVNTTSSGETTGAWAWFYGANTGGTTKSIDDFYVTDLTFLNVGPFGPSSEVRWLAPEADGAVDWAFSGADTGWQSVLTHDGDTSYCRGSGAMFDIFFEVPDVGDTDVPVAVEIVAALKKETSADPKRVRLLARSGEGADQVLTESYGYYADLYDSYANGGAPWTRTLVNDSKPGVTIPQGDDDFDFNEVAVRCTQVGMQVLIASGLPEPGSDLPQVYVVMVG